MKYNYFCTGLVELRRFIFCYNSHCDLVDETIVKKKMLLIYENPVANKTELQTRNLAVSLPHKVFECKACCL